MEWLQFLQFLQLWQEEKYFECHEVLESLWMVSTGDAKWRYQGMIHCAVALHQQRQQNWFGMARQWLRAGAKLSRLPYELDDDCRRIWSQTSQVVKKNVVMLEPSETAKLRRLRKRLQKNHPSNNQVMSLQDLFL
jgi:hypothetical protein